MPCTHFCRKNAIFRAKGAENNSFQCSFLAYRLAALHERSAAFAQAAVVYEQLADYFEIQEAWFLAADASEHAAEMLRAAGCNLAGYRRPADLWLRNAEYWVGKDAGDEAWSRHRAALYEQKIQQ